MRQFKMVSIAAGIAFLTLAAAQNQPDTQIAGPPRLPFDLAERQRQAIESMPSAQVTYHHKGTVRSIHGETGIAISRAARSLRNGESGKDVLTALRNVMLVSGKEELTVIDNVDSGPSRRALTFSESIAGIPVVGGGLGMVVESSSGLVQVLNAQFLPDRNLPRTPTLSRDEAKEAARRALYSKFAAAPESVVISEEPPTLAYVGSNDEVARDALVWVVGASYLTDEAPGQGLRNVWINALTGEYVGSKSLMRFLNRTAYTAGGAAPPTNTLPNGLTPLFTEGNAGGTDTHAITAYGNVGLVDQAWIARVGPSVLPPVRLVAHYNMAGTGYAWNASSFPWQGSHYLLFGEGDATSLSPVMLSS